MFAGFVVLPTDQSDSRKTEHVALKIPCRHSSSIVTESNDHRPIDNPLEIRDALRNNDEEKTFVKQMDYLLTVPLHNAIRPNGLGSVSNSTCSTPFAEQV